MSRDISARPTVAPTHLLVNLFMSDFWRIRAASKCRVLISLVTAIFASSAWSQTIVAGSMTGKLGVSETGAATYQVPIQVPPGIADMQPRLELSYNSQAGDGLLGNGWNLAGLSSITRCPKTYAVDADRGTVNYDTSDRFCLDGQRLVIPSGSTYGAPGTEYRTERDSFSKVTSLGSASGNSANGPDSFKVQTKAGQTMYFGGTTDSRIVVQGKSIVRVWALRRIEDVKGNFLTISYRGDTSPSSNSPGFDGGGFYPDRIDYTGNGTQAPSNSVRFVLEGRSTVEVAADTWPVYHGGAVVRVMSRIKEVQTWVGSTLVKKYVIGYAYSPLSSLSSLISIQECDGANSCLAPLTFTWKSAANLFGQTGFDSAIGSWNYPTNTSTAMRDLVADINGDGKSDLIRMWKNGTQASADIWMGSATGFTSGTSNAVGAWNYPDPNDGSVMQDLVMDVNGDSRSDLVRLRNNGSATGMAAVYLSNGSALTYAGEFAVGGWSYPADGSGMKDFALDFDGDGRTDLVRLWNNGARRYALGFRSNGSGFDATAAFNVDVGDAASSIQEFVGDVDGDGKPDLIRLWQSGSNASALVARATPAGFQTLSNGTVGAWTSLTYVMDINGDGKSDIVRLAAFGSVAHASIYYSNGVEFLAPSSGVREVGNYNTAIKNFVMDVNGDGKSDLVRVYQNGTRAYAQIYAAREEHLRKVGADIDIGEWKYTNDGTNMTIDLVMDVQGDGKSDLVRLNSVSSVGRARLALSPLSDNLDVIGTFKNSAQLATTVDYKTLPEALGNEYLKQASFSGTYVPVSVPLRVATKVTAPTGSGGTSATTYKYGDLAVDQGTGRGMLGFKWLSSKNLSSNIELYSEYHQDWPKLGMLAKSETRLAGSGYQGLLQSTTNTYVQSAGSLSPSIFVYQSKSIQQSADLNGVLLPQITTDTEYGRSPQYGDATKITVTNSGDSSTKTTVNEYWPDNTTSVWITGRLKQSTVTSVKP